MDIQEFIHGVEGLRSNLLKQARHYLNDADDAEDAVQETLVKLWVVRDRVAEASKMRNMAVVVCRNVSLNMLRDKRQTVSIDGTWEVASHAIRRYNWRNGRDGYGCNVASGRSQTSNGQCSGCAMWRICSMRISPR